MLRLFCLFAAVISASICGFSQEANQDFFSTLLDSASRAIDEEDFLAADALLKEAAKFPLESLPDSLKYLYYHKAAVNSFLSGKLEEAETMESFALAVATAADHKRGMLVSNSSLASIKSVQGKGEASLRHHKASLKLISPGDSTTYYRILNNLSHSYKSAGKLDSALQMLIESKNFYQRNGLIYEQAVSDCNIGEMYREDFNDFEMARKHYLSSLSLHKIEGGSSDFSRVYHNYGILLRLNGQADSADYFLNKSIEQRRKTGDSGGIAASLVELGRVYLDRGDFGAAISNFATALRISEKYGIERGIYHCSLTLAEAHAEIGNYRVALANYEKALRAAEQGDQLNFVLNVNQRMYELHKNAGQWAAALTSLEKYNELKESIDEKMRDSALAEIKARYETELTANENAALLLEQEMTLQKLKIQRWVLIGLILVILLFLIVGYFLYRSVKERDKALSEVQGAREDLEEKLERISLQEKRLMEANEFKNRVISVIGHDLRAPLANIIGILEVMKETDASSREMNEMFEHLQRETDTNMKSLQNLLEWARLEEEGLRPSRKEFDPRRPVEDSSRLHEAAAKNKNVSIEITGHDKIWADENQFKSVVTNLLGNAIKYSPQGGKVTVHTGETPTRYVFSVTDNGGGMPPEVIASLNTRARINSIPGTRGERGTGIGLRLVSDFARAHGGSLKLTRNEQGGTTAEVDFPKPHVVNEDDQPVFDAAR